MPTVRESCGERSSLERLQCERLRALLAQILPRNGFYARKLAGADLDNLGLLPFTTKAELLADQAAHPPYGTMLTYPRERYCRLDQTSGTSGLPLRWLDTPESWEWMLKCWETMYGIVGVRPGDRMFFAFSFGPFLGFWTAFDAAARLGYLCLPGGGMSSGARLRFLLDNQATVALSTPTYALRLAEAARALGIDLAASPVRLVIVAGEPGGSIAATRARIEEAWGARVFDHYGMTEVGPLAIECRENPVGLHVLESDCLPEVINPETTEAAEPGEIGELVLTNFGRWGSPVVRYRTGDLVRVDPRPCPCGSPFVRLDGGILGRSDDMIHFRGINVYPSALEALLRRFPEIVEYRIEVDESSALRVEIEPASGGREPLDRSDLMERVDHAIRDELLFRAEVKMAAPGSLPRFDFKARRISRKGAESQTPEGGAIR
jgi:phenylacetate-CoA ligase